MKRFLPWIILAIAAGSIAASWMPPKTAKDDFDFSRFGEIPVLVGGRVKPLDTVARNSLLIIHGKQELRLEGGKRLSAMQWLTDVLFNAPVADQYPVFVVQNADVLGLFGWQQSDRKYFSFAEFAPFLKQVDEQAAQSDKLEAVQRSAYQSAILNLRNSLSLYQRLKNSIQPEGAQNFAAELHRFESTVPGAATAAREREMGENFDKAKLDDVAAMIQRYERLSEMAYLLAVPPLGQNDQWHSVGDSLLRSVGTGEIHPIVNEYAIIGDAYRADDRMLFNQNVQLVTDWFAKAQPKATQARVVRVFVQSASALQPKHDALRARVSAGVRIVARVEQCFQAFGFLHFAARACYSHVWSGFADVSARASAGHQSVFIGNFHWLGRSHCRADT